MRSKKVQPIPQQQQHSARSHALHPESSTSTSSYSPLQHNLRRKSLTRTLQPSAAAAAAACVPPPPREPPPAALETNPPSAVQPLRGPTLFVPFLDLPSSSSSSLSTTSSPNRQNKKNCGPSRPPTASRLVRCLSPPHTSLPGAHEPIAATKKDYHDISQVLFYADDTRGSPSYRAWVRTHFHLFLEPGLGMFVGRNGERVKLHGEFVGARKGDGRVGREELRSRQRVARGKVVDLDQSTYRDNAFPPATFTSPFAPPPPTPPASPLSSSPTLPFLPAPTSAFLSPPSSPPLPFLSPTSSSWSLEGSSDDSYTSSTELDISAFAFYPDDFPAGLAIECASKDAEWGSDDPESELYSCRLSYGGYGGGS